MPALIFVKLKPKKTAEKLGAQVIIIPQLSVNVIRIVNFREIAIILAKFGNVLNNRKIVCRHFDHKLVSLLIFSCLVNDETLGR